MAQNQARVPYSPLPASRQPRKYGKIYVPITLFSCHLFLWHYLSI